MNSWQRHDDATMPLHVMASAKTVSRIEELAAEYGCTVTFVKTDALKRGLHETADQLKWSRRREQRDAKAAERKVREAERAARRGARKT